MEHIYNMQRNLDKTLKEIDLMMSCSYNVTTFRSSAHFSKCRPSPSSSKAVSTICHETKEIIKITNKLN
jgi:hypothetical protein